MLHPYQGYLAGFPKTWLVFADLERLYKHQMVSSFERCQGNTILANELSALSFWQILDKEGEGVLAAEEFK